MQSESQTTARNNTKNENFTSGYVSIIGRPNVGKSTLLNALLGQKLAIVTPKPQTTRHQIRGIVSTDTHQIIFVDTPGLMDVTKYRLHTEMVKAAYNALGGADVVLFVIDVSRARLTPTGELQEGEGNERQILARLRRTNAPTILALNKVDLVAKERLLPILAGYGARYDFAAMIPISARTQDGLPLLMTQVQDALPPGPRYFPEEQVSDLPERFFIAETVREKVMLLTQREVPYSTAVVVEEFQRRDTGMIYIRAIVYAERQTQKGILIGKGGTLIKRIGEQARRDIEKFLDARVFLELYVSVKTAWRQDIRQLRDIGGIH